MVRSQAKEPVAVRRALLGREPLGFVGLCLLRVNDLCETGGEGPQLRRTQVFDVFEHALLALLHLRAGQPVGELLQASDDGFGLGQ